MYAELKKEAKDNLIALDAGGPSDIRIVNKYVQV